MDSNCNELKKGDGEEEKHGAARVRELQLQSVECLWENSQDKLLRKLWCS